MNSLSPAFDRIRRLLRSAPHAKYLSGISFDDRSHGPMWRQFPTHIFLLPEFEIIEVDGSVSFVVNLVKNAHESLQKVHAKLSQRFEQVKLTDSHAESGFGHFTSERCIPEKTVWSASVAQAVSAIRQQAFDKVVLARCREFAFRNRLEPCMFVKYFERMKSPAYFFLLQFDQNTAFVGSSPERLYRRCGATLESEALAGTRMRGRNEVEDRALSAELLNATKDSHEHQLVYDYIRHAMSSLCSRISKDNPRYVLKLILIQHLLTTLSGTLKPNVNDEDILAILHPTPAVGGTPLDKAIACIHELEHFDRGWYAGAVGTIGLDQTEFSVAIRSGLIHNNTLTLFSGAGIVADSDPEAEWIETQCKMNNFLKVIGQRYD
ncbi:MAG: isochorismate synthase [Chitinivibrionales bacterium]|nr:isochorismate synthase [Chitinivibrionales bacterium]